MVYSNLPIVYAELGLAFCSKIESAAILSDFGSCLCANTAQGTNAKNNHKAKPSQMGQKKKVPTKVCDELVKRAETDWVPARSSMAKCSRLGTGKHRVLKGLSKTIFVVKAGFCLFSC